jgi:predicted transcriptional regulator
MEALQLFMRNNFYSISNNQKLNILYTENVFNHNDNNYISNQVNDIASGEVEEHYDLSTYIRINSDLINDIINLENMVKTLTNDQKEVTDYIKKNIDNQMLIFLSGEGEISYIICC